MRRWFALGAVFVVSLLVCLVVLMPAAVVVERVPVPRPGGAPLTLSDARGPWWDARVDARWRDRRGELRWRLDWHGLTPGVQLSMVSGDLDASGWLGADWGTGAWSNGAPPCRWLRSAPTCPRATPTAPWT